MKNIIPILLFFVTSLSYSQDMIVEFDSIKTGNRKGDATEVEIDDGVNQLRYAKIPNLKTPLAVIKYFQNQGYKVDSRIVRTDPVGLGVANYRYLLFCYKIGKGKE